MGTSALDRGGGAAALSSLMARPSVCGRYIHALVFDKEQREYVGWLKRVKGFLQQ